MRKFGLRVFGFRFGLRVCLNPYEPTSLLRASYCSFHIQDMYVYTYIWICECSCIMILIAIIDLYL